MKVNNMFKNLGLILGILALLFFPTKVLAIGYGEGVYGDNNYQFSDLVPTPTSSVQQSNSSPSSSSPSFNTTPPGCGNSVTNGVPDLFEIRANKNSATLYFSPPYGQYSSFYMAFSRNSDNWEYGTEYQQGYYPGVLRYTIWSLQPNTTYYVKIRPGNGCATGNWSNTMSFTTSTSAKEKAFYKYSKINRIISPIKSVISKITPNKKTTSEIILPKTTNSTLAPTTAIEHKKSPTPTSSFKSSNSSTSTNQSTSTTTSKKKFCFLWWCW